MRRVSAYAMILTIIIQTTLAGAIVDNSSKIAVATESVVVRTTNGLDKPRNIDGNVKYSQIIFGSYPQTEVVGQNLKSSIVKANYVNEIATVDGERYMRITTDDCQCKGSGDQVYNWSVSGDSDGYHYFRFEPIYWKVLDVDESKAVLLSDIILDCQYYNQTNVKTGCFWENSTLRSWLNGYNGDENIDGVDYSTNSFCSIAFDSNNNSSIIKTLLSNESNASTAVSSGKDTEDFVYIPSEKDMCSEDYCYSTNKSESDDARIATFSDYAYAKGIWKYGTSDNGRYWLRTSGVCEYNKLIVKGDGVIDTCDVNGLVNEVNCYGIGVRPMITIDLTRNLAVSQSKTWSLPANDFQGAYRILSDGTAELTCYFGNESYVEVDEVDGYFISRISENCFSYKNLSRIVMPSHLVYIGNNAFYYCKKLEDIIFSGKEKEIGDKTFYYCSSLSKVILPYGIEKIGAAAFKYNYGLQKFVIPETVKEIDVSNFYYSPTEKLSVYLAKDSIPYFVLCSDANVTSIEKISLVIANEIEYEFINEMNSIIDADVVYEFAINSKQQKLLNIKILNDNVDEITIKWYGCTSDNESEQLCQSASLNVDEYEGYKKFFCIIENGVYSSRSNYVSYNGYYLLNFEINDGSNDNILSKLYVDNPVINQPDPVREGYEFLGWSTSRTSMEIKYKQGDKYDMYEDITLYAVWKVNEYTVTYDANGGLGAPDSQRKTHEQALKLSEVTPTKTGYEFLGWSTNAISYDVEYNPGDIYSGNESLKLYAVWKNVNENVSTPSATLADTDISTGIGLLESSEKKTPIFLGTNSIKKTFSKKKFSLGINTDSDGKVKYNSSNKKVITVDKAGKITIKGYGNAAIIIKVSETSEYKAATKKIKITIIPDKVKKFKVKSNSSGGVSFSWKKVNDKNAKCQIQASSTSDFSDTKSIPDKAMKLGKLVNIRGLTRGKVWYFRSRVAVNVSGKTYYSGWVVRKVKIK